MNLASPDMDGCYSRHQFRRWCDGQPKGRCERVDGRTWPLNAASDRGSTEQSAGRWTAR
jgi:hypothetical protein